MYCWGTSRLKISLLVRDLLVCTIFFDFAASQILAKISLFQSTEPSHKMNFFFMKRRNGSQRCLNFYSFAQIQPEAVHCQTLPLQHNYKHISHITTVIILNIFAYTIEKTGCDEFGFECNKRRTHYMTLYFNANISPLIWRNYFLDILQDIEPKSVNL